MRADAGAGEAGLPAFPRASGQRRKLLARAIDPACPPGVALFGGQGPGRRFRAGGVPCPRARRAALPGSGETRRRPGRAAELACAPIVLRHGCGPAAGARCRSACRVQVASRKDRCRGAPRRPIATGNGRRRPDGSTLRHCRSVRSDDKAGRSARGAGGAAIKAAARCSRLSGGLREPGAPPRRPSGQSSG